MLVAHYIGSHTQDTLSVRIGWALTRYTQSGEYGHVTHSEAIHHLYQDGSILMASSSKRDGGVRAKQARLNPENWMIVDCPNWPVSASIDLLEKTEGQGYDLRGALATRLPGNHQSDRWFCNEWVGFPFVPASQTFGPHHFCALTLSQGKDITVQFFKER